MTNSFSTFCYYRVNDVFCWNGHLHLQKTNAPVLVEDKEVPCPACNGLGRVPTDLGKEMLVFIETFARPLIEKIIEESCENS